MLVAFLCVSVYYASFYFQALGVESEELYFIRYCSSILWYIPFVQAAELEKNRTDQNGNAKADTHGKLRSLRDIFSRSDVSGSSSQEGREDSDYDDEMELDYETSVSGDESRENDQGVFRGSLSFRFHQREDQTNEHTGENGSTESTHNDDSAFQVFLFCILDFLCHTFCTINIWILTQFSKSCDAVGCCHWYETKICCTLQCGDRYKTG